MNRINELFSKKNKNILSIYFTAGYPNLNDTLPIICELEKQGIDMVELGIPFSAPVADGPIIQESSRRALENGININLIFEQLSTLRTHVKIPIVLMSYFNPIIKFGFENICKRCQEVGIDGLIIPDMPFNMYLSQYKSLVEKYNIKVVTLITPDTSDDRIRLIDKNTDSFLYMVSSTATTGTQNSFVDQQEYFQRVNSLNLKNPRLIGFGISNKSTLDSAFTNASGAIIGSKFVSLLKTASDTKTAILNLKVALQN